MAKILRELFLKGKLAFYAVRAISLLFCFMLGALATIVFSEALIYLTSASGKKGPSVDKLDDLFTTIGLVAVAVVVLDLAVTIYREMVTSEGEKRHPSRVRGSLTRFIVMVVIAVLIKDLIMLFRFSEADKIHLIPYALLTFAGALLLILGLGFYLRMTIPIEKLTGRDKEDI